MHEKKTPLIDAEWLLGPVKPSNSSRLAKWRARTATFGVACLLCVVFVLVAPPASSWWIREQLLQQFYSANTHSDRELAILSLAEMLPQSSSQLADALTCKNRKLSQAAYDSLETYTQILMNQPHEELRSSGLAHVLDAIGESILKIPSEQRSTVIAMTQRLETNLKQRPFNGSSILSTSCQQIIATGGSFEPIQSLAQEPQLATPNSSGSTVTIDRPSKTSSFESEVIHPSLLQSQSQAVASLRDPEALVMSPAQQDLSTANSPLGHSITSELDSPSNVAVFKNPRSVQPGNLRIETASLVSSPSPNPSDIFTQEMPLVEAPFVDQSDDSLSQKTAEGKADFDDANDNSPEVIGIDRQKTEDLIALLGSVRAKVASAALYELERRGMSEFQLEVAVDLARGTSEARLGALERLIHQQEFDPTPWLAWIASDRDRSIRHRAVSMLGSLNSNSSRTKLRLLLARERDEEISRHIQQILLSGSKTLSARSHSPGISR